jgi:hypothetical protein
MGYPLCHVRSSGIHYIRVGYTLVDVTVLASVMSQRYVTELEGFHAIKTDLLRQA